MQQYKQTEVDTCTVVEWPPWYIKYKRKVQDFPGGTVVKNPPANAGDTGSIPGPGRSHMPRSN